MRLSDDAKKIRRNCPFRVYSESCKTDEDYNRLKRIFSYGCTSYRTLCGNVQPFIHALKNGRYLTAKRLLKTDISSVAREYAEMDVLKSRQRQSFDFSSLLQFKSLYSLMKNGNGEESYVLLLWATFPKLLLMHHDIIHEPAPYDRTFINWEYYCVELLQEIHRLGGTEVEKVIELTNIDFSRPKGDLCKVNGVNAEGALLLAKAFCNSKIIVVHDHMNTVWIKDLSLSGNMIADRRRTTYCLPSLIHGRVREMERLREVTEKEAAYLKHLRWKARLPALLVAARFREGRHFGALVVVASFL